MRISEEFGSHKLRLCAKLKTFDGFAKVKCKNPEAASPIQCAERPVLRPYSGGTAGTKAVLYAAGPLFTQRPPNSTPLSPPAVFADTQKRKKPPKPGQSHCCAGY